MYNKETISKRFTPSLSARGSLLRFRQTGADIRRKSLYLFLYRCEVEINNFKIGGKIAIVFYLSLTPTPLPAIYWQYPVNTNNSRQSQIVIVILINRMVKWNSGSINKASQGFKCLTVNNRFCF